MLKAECCIVLSFHVTESLSGGFGRLCSVLVAFSEYLFKYLNKENKRKLENVYQKTGKLEPTIYFLYTIFCCQQQLFSYYLLNEHKFRCLCIGCTTSVVLYYL